MRAKRKGFGQIDRYEVLRPEACPHCRGKSFEAAPAGVRYQQVAQLRERPIEVVEYQQVRCTCAVVEAALPKDVIAGQDLGVSLQAMLVAEALELRAARMALGDGRPRLGWGRCVRPTSRCLRE